ncbi:MAG: hypothetical protein F6K32_08065 [Desertifilum sp. SIO1I2]|nr:hypothetical protein [Desertifilum sp. SIO1I2]
MRIETEGLGNEGIPFSKIGLLVFDGLETGLHEGADLVGAIARNLCGKYAVLQGLH